MRLLEIETATFRVVAQCVKHEEAHTV